MLKLAIKDLKLFFADKWAMIITFALPIALTTLMVFAFGGAGQQKSEPKTLVVADNDKSDASKNVIAQLDSSKEFEVMQKSSDEAENLVKKGKEEAVLIFHKGFGDSLNAGNNPLIEFKYDAAKEVEVRILQGALTGKLMGIIGKKSMTKNMFVKIHAQISKSFSSDETNKQSESFLKATPLVSEKENSPMLVQSVAGMAIMMLLFSVAVMGASLLDEKREGTLKKLLYSPMPSNSILYGKMLYVNLISIFQLVIMFIFANLAFGLDIFSHLPSLLLMIIATAFACSSFGILLASFAKSSQQVSGMSTLIILVMSCIGGSMLPTFFMPAFMQKISIFSVNYWGIQGFYDIFWRMLPLTDTTFLSRIFVLLLMGTIMNFIALQIFKKNILKIA